MKPPNVSPLSLLNSIFPWATTFLPFGLFDRVAVILSRRFNRQCPDKGVQLLI